ncbi:hypothetical protein ABZ914_12515, partial [Spirillospora sp. NPDC046719]
MEDQKVAPFDSAPTPAAPTLTDLPVITDPGFYTDPAYAAQSVPPEDAPSPPAGDGAGTGLDTGLDTVPRAGIARLGDPVAVWPCAGFGTPVPHPVR